MSTLPSGASGIPAGWNVQDLPDYLRLTIRTAGTMTVSIPAGLTTANLTDLSISRDWGVHWTQHVYDNTAQEISVALQAGETLMLKGHAVRYSDGTPQVSAKIDATSTFDAAGNMMSLLDADNFASLTAVSSFAFAYMFNASGIALPPLLPATTIAEGCYKYMFAASHLSQSPSLPATTLAKDCYQAMFRLCLFNFQISPVLPALVLAPGCYAEMFRLSSSIHTITMLATDISAQDCLSDWVAGVSSTGTFIKNAAMLTLPTGDSGIPSGWTVEDNV
jgi:hypothetical protein